MRTFGTRLTSKKKANVSIKINFNHSEAAHDLLVQPAEELDVEVVIISKAYRGKDRVMWAAYKRG